MGNRSSDFHSAVGHSHGFFVSHSGYILDRYTSCPTPVDSTLVLTGFDTYSNVLLRWPNEEPPGNQLRINGKLMTSSTLTVSTLDGILIIRLKSEYNTTCHGFWLYYSGMATICIFPLLVGDTMELYKVQSTTCAMSMNASRPYQTVRFENIYSLNGSCICICLDPEPYMALLRPRRSDMFTDSDECPLDRYFAFCC